MQYVLSIYEITKNEQKVKVLLQCLAQRNCSLNHTY